MRMQFGSSVRSRSKLIVIIDDLMEKRTERRWRTFVQIQNESQEIISFLLLFFCGRRRRRRRRWVVCVRRIRLIDTHFFAHAIICRLSYWLLEFIRRRLHCLVREFKKKSPRTTPERISHIFVNWHD